MNDIEVTKTIQQMVRFIKQEAEEKASEIMVAAEEEFNITKLQLLEAEKAKVRREYERREGATEVKKKVEYSKQLNESRLKILQAQDDAVRAIRRDSQARLAALCSNAPAYRKLIRGLMLQALARLGESKAKVRCRAVDKQVVTGLLSDVSAEVAKRTGVPAASVVIEVDEVVTLPPPPTKGTISEEFDTCAGGVVVTTYDGRIVCSNTLDDRLGIAYGSSLPELRALLFATPSSEA